MVVGRKNTASQNKHNFFLEKSSEVILRLIKIKLPHPGSVKAKTSLEANKINLLKNKKYLKPF